MGYPRNAALGTILLLSKPLRLFKIPSDSDQFNVTSAVLQLSRMRVQMRRITKGRRTSHSTRPCSPWTIDCARRIPGVPSVQARRVRLSYLNSITRWLWSYVASFRYQPLPNRLLANHCPVMAIRRPPAGTMARQRPVRSDSPLVRRYSKVQTRVSIDNSQNGRTLQIQASITYPDGSHASAGKPWPSWCTMVYHSLRTSYVRCREGHVDRILPD